MKKNTLTKNTVCGISNSLPSISLVLIVFMLLDCNLFTSSLYAQGVAINITGQAPKSSAALDLSTGNGGKYGFLPPKVALQATNVTAPITTPSNGLVVFDTVTAGTAPYNVSQGFYYWNSTSALWVGLNSAPNTPYGNNTHSWAATAIQGPVTSSTYVAMGPTITFTPVHSTVYLTFTAAGFAPFPTSINESIQFEVLKGATVLAGGSSLCEATDGNGTVSSFSFSLLLPITVTPGTSTTISIDWKVTIAAAETADPAIECNVTGYPDDTNASLFIND